LTVAQRLDRLVPYATFVRDLQAAGRGA
jgi:hypothetical protein